MAAHSARPQEQEQLTSSTRSARMGTDSSASGQAPAWRRYSTGKHRSSLHPDDARSQVLAPLRYSRKNIGGTVDVLDCDTGEVQHWRRGGVVKDSPSRSASEASLPRLNKTGLDRQMTMGQWNDMTLERKAVAKAEEWMHSDSQMEGELRNFQKQVKHWKHSHPQRTGGAEKARDFWSCPEEEFVEYERRPLRQVREILELSERRQGGVDVLEKDPRWAGAALSRARRSRELRAQELAAGALPGHSRSEGSSLSRLPSLARTHSLGHVLHW